MQVGDLVIMAHRWRSSKEKNIGVITEINTGENNIFYRVVWFGNKNDRLSFKGEVLCEPQKLVLI